MPESGDRFCGRARGLRRAAAWLGAAGIYGAAQGLSAWAAQRAQGHGTRPQYEQFERPAFLARRVDQTAAVLTVPEVAWTAFATVLSTAVAAKNG